MIFYNNSYINVIFIERNLHYQLLFMFSLFSTINLLY